MASDADLLVAPGALCELRRVLQKKKMCDVWKNRCLGGEVGWCLRVGQSAREFGVL